MKIILNKKISKHYNKKRAESYESLRNTEIWHSEIEVFKKIVTKYSSINSNKKLSILDIPSGTGRWIPFIKDICSQYVGVDIYPNMLEEAKLKLKNCSSEFKKNSKLINSSVSQLPLNYQGKFDLIISTRFLTHFSISEVINIMKVLRNYSRSNLIIMVRVSDNKLNIFFEILNLVLKSPLRAIKRYFKSGRLSYSKVYLEYEAVFKETHFRVIQKHLVHRDRYSRFEYWELT